MANGKMTNYKYLGNGVVLERIGVKLGTHSS